MENVMQKFVINVVEKRYAKFEVEAENIEEAKDILASGKGVIVEIKNEFAEPDVVTDYYDSNWNDL
jgi:hypothetical protein|tara:strand:- start:235 stop:432 length:198 start_codon:yes stop_codon:yes gene_type:complete